MASRNGWIARALDSYERPLARYAHRLVGDPETARDVVQDCFLRLCKQRPAKVEDHVRQWLFTVCRNRSLDHLRKTGRMDLLEDREVITKTTPANQAEQREERDLVATSIKRLPHRQRELLHLKFIEGFSYRQIASITKLSVSNVGFILHTALKTLRTQLAPARSES